MLGVARVVLYGRVLLRRHGGEDEVRGRAARTRSGTRRRGRGQGHGGEDEVRDTAAGDVRDTATGTRSETRRRGRGQGHGGEDEVRDTAAGARSEDTRVDARDGQQTISVPARHIYEGAAGTALRSAPCPIYTAPCPNLKKQKHFN